MRAQVIDGYFVHFTEDKLKNTKPMLVFLTDVQASTAITNRATIKGADFSLMKEISEDAGSWAKRICEALDTLESLNSLKRLIIHAKQASKQTTNL